MGLISTPFLPNLLVSELENRYEVFKTDNLNSSCESVNILVLGGGHTNDIRLPDNNQLTSEALGRLIEGIRLQQLLPESNLITSGAGINNGISQAEVLKRTALMLKVDTAKIQMQITPINTWMEATEYKHIYNDTAQLIIVTCAVHMPRAMYLFQHVGLKPMAAPTNHMIKKSNKSVFWLRETGSASIRKMEKATKENIGILWYKLGEIIGKF